MFILDEQLALTKRPYFKEIINITQPKNILEIGFFAGESAYAWLANSTANLLSVDPMFGTDNKIEVVEQLHSKFPGRFQFLQKDSKTIRPDIAGLTFDLIFIDGDHSYEGAKADFQLALELGTKWVVADDFVMPVDILYFREFQDKYRLYQSFSNISFFEGRPIPTVLLERI